jgi:hypothetical protein
MEENKFSTIETLVAAVRFYDRISEEIEADVPVLAVIMFDEVGRTTKYICLNCCWDDFAIQLDDALLGNGWRPIAFEAMDEDFTCIDLEYISEPTVEDEAIIDSCFMTEESTEAL